jgi:4-hydroxybenzoate polyprenyltransferase
MLRAILELCRISNLPTVWTNVFAAWILSINTPFVWDARLGYLLLGSSLLYSAGMMLNDAADVAWDRAHRPERPIPSGRISARMVWILVSLGLLGGYAIMVVLGGAQSTITALLVAAIVGYDVYHKPWSGSVIIMGACRTLLYFSVSSAIQSAFTSNRLLVLQSLLLGVYIVGLTIAARSESSANPSPLGKKVSRALLLSPALLPLCAAYWGYGWQAFAILPFYALLLWFALKNLRQGGPQIGQAVGILLAGITIVDALAVATKSLPFALAFVATAPLLRRWQRWVAAT